MKLLVAALVAACIATALGQQVFRSETVAVTVDVRVTNGRRPLRGLTASDFELSDNGVRQQIDLVVEGSEPLDVVLLCDLSASTYVRPIGTPYGFRAGDIRHWVEEVSNAAQSLVGARDRVTRFGFSSAIAPLASGRTDPPSFADLQAKHARTAMFDAIAEALMGKSQAGFRRVILAITDGRDTVSVIDERVLLEIADRSEATVYVLAVGGREPLLLPGISNRPVTTVDGFEWLLTEFVGRTGGKVLKLLPSNDPRSELRNSLSQIRQRYTVTYTPREVEQPGWHQLQVAVPGARGAVVTARRGYWR